jgi:hypothetical protein
MIAADGYSENELGSNTACKRPKASEDEAFGI